MEREPFSLTLVVVLVVVEALSRRLYAKAFIQSCRVCDCVAALLEAKTI